jgi:hypothetical protein
MILKLKIEALFVCTHAKFGWGVDGKMISLLSCQGAIK